MLLAIKVRENQVNLAEQRYSMYLL